MVIFPLSEWTAAVRKLENYMMLGIPSSNFIEMEPRIVS